MKINMLIENGVVGSHEVIDRLGSGWAGRGKDALRFLNG